MATPTLLGGIDVFHLVNDRVMRARGLPGNHCVFVAELEGQLDLRALEARLARAVRALPELGWRLAGVRPQRPRWVIDAGRAPPPVRTQAIATRAELPSAIEGLLARRTGGDAPWALDVLRLPDRDLVALRWFHSLVDGKGAERLLRWLGSGGDSGPEPPPPVKERFETSERPIAALDREARMKLMRTYNAHVRELGRVPILSLARAVGGARPGSARCIRVQLSADETKAFDRRVRVEAKLAETSVMIAAAARIADAPLLARGFAPAQQLVPVPLSLDPKVGATRLLGNHLTMMMLSLDREDLRDDAKAIAHLGDQQRAIVRQKLDVGMAAALDFARWMPSWPYHWISTSPFGGEMASFIFSNPGAVTLNTFAGLAVVDAYPLPSVVMPPGFQVIFTRFGGRLSALVTYLDGLLPAREAEGLGRDLRRDLLGGGYGSSRLDAPSPPG